MSAATSSKKIFISYARPDQGFALELYDALCAAGLDAWIDTRDLKTGEPWAQRIESSLSESAAVVVILTPHAVASDSVLDEISYALDTKKQIFPVLLSSCKLPLRLNRLNYFDFRDRNQTDIKEIIAALSSAVGAEAPRPVLAPPPPAHRPAPRLRFAKALAFLVLIAIAATAAYGLRRFLSNRACAATDWRAQSITSPLLKRCGACKECLDRRLVADRLRQVRNWQEVRYDNKLLDDCMSFRPCLDRKSHADQLIKVTNWKDLGIADPRLADCMGYLPCEERKNRAPLLDSTRRACYCVLDLGARGATGKLYSITEEYGSPAAELLSSNRVNSRLVSSMKNARLTEDGIRDAVNAVQHLASEAREEAAKKGFADVRFSITGSSSLGKAVNRDDLANAVNAATGFKMSFIDGREEIFYGLLSSVPRPEWASATYVDIGSGTTRLGCLVGGSDLSNFKTAEIVYGLVSGRNEAFKRNAANIRAGVEQLMNDEVRPSYLRQSMDAPCLRNRASFYWAGGAAWSTVTMMHPEEALYASVQLTRKDLASFLSLLENGTWKQVKLAYAFPQHTLGKDAAKIKAMAERERADVMDTFAAEDLIAGVSIMQTIMESSSPAAEIHFVRGVYTHAFVLRQYEEDHHPQTQRGH